MELQAFHHANAELDPVQLASVVPHLLPSTSSLLEIFR